MSSHRRLKSPSRKSSRKYLFYAIFLSISGFFFGYRILFPTYKTNFIDNVGYQFGLHSNVYAVIIDAGSTGSRISALHFYRSALDGSLKLHDDLFLTNKPGLSSFSENPREGARKIVELINKAQNFVPKDAWPSTPIALRATAGLRLLPPQKAEGLLNEVRTVVNESPFLSDKNSVSIMDGKDEGLFSWFTVNFLLNRLVGNLSESVVTLDLGGGSVQVTFIPTDSARIAHQSPDHLYKVSILNHQVQAYCYSYLGLGLMAARRNVFLVENAEGSNELYSSCINPGVKNQKWKYGGREFVVHGKPTVHPSEVYEKCVRMVRKEVSKYNVDKPSEIFEHEIVAFSYFFDRAVDAGIIDGSIGAKIRVDEYKTYAMKHCNVATTDKPFLCLDLTFIYSLLEIGFGLKPSTSLQLLDTIDGHEISWALGAAYSTIEHTSK